eukprot:COSAG01_NODE_345_length_18538_cov_64.139433_13_plen_100_part_00
MGGMTIATWPNEDLTETEDERMCVCPQTDRREVRKTDKGEGGKKIRKDTEQESRSLCRGSARVMCRERGVPRHQTPCRHRAAVAAPRWLAGGQRTERER